MKEETNYKKEDIAFSLFMKSSLALILLIGFMDMLFLVQNFEAAPYVLRMEPRFGEVQKEIPNRKGSTLFQLLYNYLHSRFKFMCIPDALGGEIYTVALENRPSFCKEKIFINFK